MDYIKELIEETKLEILKLNNLLTIIEMRENKEEIMRIRNRMIQEKYRNRNYQKEKHINMQLKITTNNLLEEFDEYFHITDNDYDCYHPKRL